MVVRAQQQQGEPTGKIISKVYGMKSENLIFFPLTSLPYKFQFIFKVITHRKLLILKLVTYMSVVYHLRFNYPKHKQSFLSSEVLEHCESSKGAGFWDKTVHPDIRSINNELHF